MILDDQKEEVLSNLGGDEMAFSIDASTSHIFEILRKNQYQNGKESLVREIMANARDAHIEAGRGDVPIKVWLSDNYLTIQDFGVGMSPERVKDVYLHYGRSTKRDVNTQQGGFGIGAKSFFSYASSASIITIHGGMKREYVSYLNETNVGAMKLISETPTDEGNGTSVKIPIEKYHLGEFSNYVRKYAQFMEPTPIVLGATHYGELEKPTIIMEGSNWKVFEGVMTNQYNVLLDGIPYKYNTNTSGVEGVTFIFPTGTLLPSSTRETITKCERNDRLMAEAEEAFKLEIKQKVEDAIANCNDFVEVIKHIHSAQKYNIGSHLWEWGGGTLNYPYENHSETTMLRCHRSYGCLRKISAIYFNHTELSKNSFILVPDDFDFDGVKGYTTRKINHYRAEKGLNDVYLVKSHHGVPDNMVVRLEDIKITNGGYVKRPRVKNPVRTTIYARPQGKQTRKTFSIDNANGRDIIYTTDLDEMVSKYRGLGSLDPMLVEVAEKDVKHIKGKPGWYTIQEYIEEKLTKHFTKSEIELEYKKRVTNDTYHSYSYLKDHLPEDYKVSFEPAKLSHEQFNIVEFITENGELEKPVIPDLLKRYPLLNCIYQYHVKGAPDNSSYYTTKVHFNDVVQYIKLVNKEIENAVTN